VPNPPTRIIAAFHVSRCNYQLFERSELTLHVGGVVVVVVVCGLRKAQDSLLECRAGAIGLEIRDGRCNDDYYTPREEQSKSGRYRGRPGVHVCLACPRQDDSGFKGSPFLRPLRALPRNQLPAALVHPALAPNRLTPVQSLVCSLLFTLSLLPWGDIASVVPIGCNPITRSLPRCCRYTPFARLIPFPISSHRPAQQHVLAAAHVRLDAK
jgi:hypothetical protein